jgi:glycosyltransferase involved in cell wall biosynthesis
MKIVYSFPHPSDHLSDERAGHVIRANSMIAALRSLGHDVQVVEAASAVGLYRRAVQRSLPAAASVRIRDVGRQLHAHQFANRLGRVVAEHRPDAIIETEVVFAVAGARASRRYSLPLALDDVAPAWEAATHYDLASPGAARRARTTTTNQATVVVAVSGAIRDELVGEGIDERKLVIVPNGVASGFDDSDAAGRAVRRSLGFADSDVVVGFVGSFQPFHGVDLLVRAFSDAGIASRARLLLVGDGDGLSATREAIDELGIGHRAHLVGRKPHAEVPAYVAACDVTALPATAQYTNPMKLYEYAAAGKPSIAPRAPGVLEIVHDEEEGLLFDPTEAGSMATCLRRLVDDRDLRERLGRRARTRSGDYTWRSRAGVLVDAIRARAGE